MWGATCAVCLLVLGSAWTLPTAPGPPEAAVQTQENFDLSRFMGKWYEVAVVSSCPHYMKRKSVHPVVATVHLQHAASAPSVTTTTTVFRNATCKQMTSYYSLTDTPGRFSYHIARMGADVDNFVVETDYDEYAMLYLLSSQNASGHVTQIVKLYSRAVNVTAPVLEDFKTLVTEHGMDADTIIMNQDKGECVPEEQVAKPQVRDSHGDVRKVKP